LSAFGRTLSSSETKIYFRVDFSFGLIYTGERQICLKIRPKTLSGKGKPAAFALVHLPARPAVFIYLAEAGAEAGFPERPNFYNKMPLR